MSVDPRYACEYVEAASGDFSCESAEMCGRSSQTYRAHRPMGLVRNAG